MSITDNEQEIAKGCALIRTNLHIDPFALTPEEWAARMSEAVWLEKMRMQNFASTIAKLFQPPRK